MKIILISYLTFFSACLFGQENKYTVSGLITDCKTKLPLIAFPVKVVCSNGNAVEVKTDSTGTYAIELNYDKPPLSCVVVFSVAANPISCLYTGEKTKFTIEDTLVKSRIENVCLVNMGKMEEKWFPSAYFEKDSYSNYKSDDSLRDQVSELVKIMNDNPGFIVQVNAHASSDEVKPAVLSEKRANYIILLLVKNGIEYERLVAKSYGDKMSAEKKDPYGIALVPEDDAERNRRVVFAVLRKDYISPKAIKTK